MVLPATTHVIEPSLMKRWNKLLVTLVFGSTILCGAPSRAEVTQVRIGIQYGLAFLPITVAQVQGFYAERARKAGLGDLKVTIEHISGSPALNDALLSESIEIGGYGTPGLL